MSTPRPPQDTTLRSKLPHDYAKTLSERLEHRFTAAHIRAVVQGRRYNLEITEAALALAEETKAMEDSIRQRIANL